MFLQDSKERKLKYYYKDYIRVGENMEDQVVASVRVDRGFWKEVKKYAIDKGLTLTELVEQALRNEMRPGSKKVGKEGD